jgi:hypothetical protein
VSAGLTCQEASCPYAHLEEKQRTDFGHWAGRVLGASTVTVAPTCVDVVLSSAGPWRAELTLRNTDPWIPLELNEAVLALDGDAVNGICITMQEQPLVPGQTVLKKPLRIPPTSRQALELTVAAAPAVSTSVHGTLQLVFNQGRLELRLPFSVLALAKGDMSMAKAEAC